jgi:hypothetical protein
VGGDFKPNLEPLTKGLVKSGMSVKEYLEQENEKTAEIEPFKPSETWWQWLRNKLRELQSWIGENVSSTKEMISVFETLKESEQEQAIPEREGTNCHLH